MINFIPIFPLNIVVYPGEQLNLHIFEPRYKQLIRECVQEKKPFGIPTVIDHKLEEYGTRVFVTEIVKEYDNGELDITTRGEDVFRILEVIREVPEKLYEAAIVDYPANVFSAPPQLMPRILPVIRELHKLLNVSKSFKKKDEELSSYDVAHHVALSLNEEYELLTLLREDQRLEYLKRHLNKVVPFLSQMELLKEKIKLNGHFRNLEGLDFEWKADK
ncbi:LON peptidase substrate-binding domain-containing protein [Parasegetibacter sp. NRK P23]|uniref:LON peptidase substrate-binding domain-containing protein n=1 Tax=Parasegetibacter sp. NRK P23 TaxID=2942999 RepID=UPI0020434D84|nr:LON peptidase substrate-binding domain-containing protein [Parasegetibacter sp. NRK P23]MCM5530036.1 LON peptidase substrate-binding domain-containing protein [Parasegetibacter sp. NRK P23]